MPAGLHFAGATDFQGGSDGGDYFACDFQYFYDICLVRPFKIQGHRALEGGCDQLADCFFLILFSGAGQPHRVLPVYDGPVENDSGNHHADGFLFFFGVLSRRIPEVEHDCGVFMHGRCRFFYFRQVKPVRRDCEAVQEKAEKKGV